MDSSKLSVKFLFQDGTAPHSETIVPVFHRWVQNHLLPEHQLIDVADYQHVVAGPGTVLVSHEANLTTDQADHLPGLIYIRKTPLDGDLSQRLLKVFGYALQACKLLEDDESFQPRVKFRTDNPIIKIHDRLEAPNTADTFKALKPAIAATVQQLFGSSAKLTHVADEKKLFEVRITASGHDTIGDILSRLNKGAPAPHLEPPEYSL
jgi:hypothetical protein